MATETTAKSSARFHRESLRVVRLRQSTEGRYGLEVKTLDRDTLRTRRTNIIFPATTMEMIVGIYVTDFCPDKIIRV